MTISGFTFVRNAVRFDYPVVESIRSILPIVDEFIVSVGNSGDNTEELIRSIGSSKIKIAHSVWDESLREGGAVLAAETDKALAHVNPLADWAFYLQADEVVHEKDLDRIVNTARIYKDDQKVDGLLFKYVHFFGTYDHVGDSHRWYTDEIRLIKNNGTICSYRDAQGFRTKQNKKLRVKRSGADIYHYGWVRHPQTQRERLNDFYKFWDGEKKEAADEPRKDHYDYTNEADSVEYFTGTHPAVMQKRIAEKNWHIDLDTEKKRLSKKHRLLYGLEKKLGKKLFDYKNYRLV